MNDDRSIEEIFCTAIEIESASDRQSWLDQACGDDAKLRRQLDRLLLAHFRGGSIVDAPGHALDVTVNKLPSERPGTQIGPYKLLQQIGEGGMGTVYMAEQSHPVQRKVALKVIKAGMDSSQVIARFEAERQALALMDHPDIAKVFDAGTTAEGRPYFVMELVKGVPITTYCDENHLTPKARLKLFAQVCQAVQHAHQKGIIHRDIKPTNVLISLYDDRPVPKVIDFGVAKATGGRLTDRTMFTDYGQIVGTLEYMSPEQARLNALDVDTRGDIYSLGVLLYELLTGTTPFDKRRLREAAFDEMLRMIREEEPPKPSTRLSSAEGRASIAANRSMEPSKLSGLVRGELDWIVMKALEKDRNRRYETANDFAQDLQRYLDDEPVQACPPSSWYRFRKFVRRNKQAVFVAALIFFALVAGVVGTTWSLIREQQHSQDLQAARERERQLNERARQAIETITSNEAIDQLTRERELRPEQRDFLDKMIQYYAEAARDAPSTEQERSRQERAYFRMGRMNHVLGRSQDGENAYRQAVALARQLVADFPAEAAYRHQLAGNLNNLATLLQHTNRLSEAETTFIDAVAIHRQLAAEFRDRPEFRQALAGVLNNLGNVCCETNRLPEAETALTEALAIRKQLVVELPDQPILPRALAMSHNSLGWFFQISNRLPEAEAAYAAALAHYKELDLDVVFSNRPEFRMELAKSQRNLSSVFGATNRPKEQEEAYAEALNILRQLVADFPNRPEFRQELAEIEGQEPHARK